MEFRFKPLSNPILFVGDNPSLPGGLSRIGRDLSTLVCTLPEFRVGYMGRGIGQRRKLPFVLYDYPEHGQWGENYIKQVWADFAGSEPGIIMTLDDITRRHWMVQTDDPFFGSNRTFKLWMYTPVDSVGPNGRSLTRMSSVTAYWFDRVLAASEFGCRVLKESAVHKADWLPHGIHTDHFHTRRGDKPDMIRVGCVMTNQFRKDWPTAFTVFKQLLLRYGNRFQAWVHVDTLIRYWDINALTYEFGLENNIDVTVTLSDAELGERYRSCACTILPSRGEGFGYPIAESMMCGTPCIVTDYAGGPELVPPACRCSVFLSDCFIDSIHNVLRPKLNSDDFYARTAYWVDSKLNDWEGVSKQIREEVEHLEWDKLRIPWERWFRDGIR